MNTIAIDRSVDIPDGVTLLKEKLQPGATYQKIATKYNTSKQAIQQKIQRVLKQFDPDTHELYLKDNTTILKAIEAYHIMESVNPEKTKKMSAYQHTGMGKLIWEMRRTEEGKSTENSVNISLVADVNTLLKSLKE